MLDLDFHRKINKMNEKLHAEGIMTAPTPSASQILNLDEKIGSVNPGAKAAFTLGRKPCVAHRHRRARPVSSVDTLHRLRRCQSGAIPSMDVYAGGTDELMQGILRAAYHQTALCTPTHPATWTRMALRHMHKTL